MAALNIYIKNKMSSTTNIEEVTSMLDLKFNGNGGGTTSEDMTKTTNTDLKVEMKVVQEGGAKDWTYAGLTPETVDETLMDFGTKSTEGKDIAYIVRDYTSLV
jgi:hypothetical protein